MIDTTRDAFEAFKNTYGGGFLNDQNDDSDKLQLTIARDFWQAATAVEQERCALVCVAVKTVSGTDDVERGWNAAMRRVATAIRQGGAS